MAWLGELLTAAGPWAGWVLSGLLGTGALYLYATDRLISRGRNAEQATHYEHLLAQQQENHAQQLDQLRRHMTELVEVERRRAESLAEDRNYWRDDVALDMMNAVAALVGRQPSGSG